MDWFHAAFCAIGISQPSAETCFGSSTQNGAASTATKGAFAVESLSEVDEELRLPRTALKVFKHSSLRQGSAVGRSRRPLQELGRKNSRHCFNGFQVSEVPVPSGAKFARSKSRLCSDTPGRSDVCRLIKETRRRDDEWRSCRLIRRTRGEDSRMIAISMVVLSWCLFRRQLAKEACLVHAAGSE
ncbi:hypothetical protein IWZ01DRAFT_107692 [Phyllosticta capitalensis]